MKVIRSPGEQGMQPASAGSSPPLEHDGEPTYSCPDCLGTAYVSHERSTKFGLVTVSWFCDCDKGRIREVYYWFDALHPMSGGHRASKSPAGEKELREYLSANPLQRRWLPDAIEARRKRHEDERKKKLQALEESAR
jgi:hypothetical protein